MMKNFLMILGLSVGLSCHIAQAQNTAPQYSETLMTLAQNPKATSWVSHLYDEVLRRQNLAIQSTQELHNAVKTSCWAKDRGAQKAWLKAYQEWVSATTFSVIDDSTTSAVRQIYFRPTRPALIDEAIAKKVGLDATANIDEIGVAAKGLAALEYVLFAGKKTPERCAYANWLVDQLTVDVQQLKQSTQKLVVQRQIALKDPQKRIPATAQGIEELTNALISKASEVAGRDLIKLSIVKKDAVLSPYAGQSKAIVGAQLNAWKDYALGQSGQGAILKDGLADYLYNDAQQNKLAQDLTHHVSNVMKAADALPQQFAPLALKQPLPQKVNIAVNALQDAQALLESDIADALGVTVSFNDADGD